MRKGKNQMGALQRLKPYKNAKPEETVNRIRQILYRKKIFVIEVGHQKEPETGVCSCRVIFGDDRLRDLNIGSNGKGMDTKYALASAYAEFMERIQNGALFWKVHRMEALMTDAFSVSQKELARIASDFLRIAYGNLSIIDETAKIYSETESRPVVATFTEYGTDNSIDIPVGLLNILAGSNGMAAGNTLLEAIIQGLSEIFERDALLDIFLNHATPPEVPEEFFDETDVLRRIKALEKYGIKYKILDCSLGKGLPVLGLLLEKEQKYHVQFGADPSPITALERCLTETFQGRSISELPFLPPLNETENKTVLFENTKKEFTDSTGQVPQWMLSGEDTWNFNGFTHPVSLSEEKDMEYYLQILYSLHKKLYVKNTSYLGFPSVRLYVPGMTEKNCRNLDISYFLSFPSELEELMQRLPLLSDAEFQVLAKGIRQWMNLDSSDQSSYFANTSHLTKIRNSFPCGLFSGRRWDSRLLVAAIYYRGGLLEEGEKWLSQYFEDNGISGRKAELIRIRLRSNRLTFLPTEWPQCPDCDKCQAVNLCYQKELKELENNLYCNCLISGIL